MKNKYRKATLDDGCNPELVANAIFDGIIEMPLLSAHKYIFVPQEIVPFSMVNRVSNQEEKAVGFYEMDNKFSGILIDPDSFLPVISKFGAFITPDCSLYRSAPLPVQLINVYRNRVIGLHFQERGIYVIPQIRWGNEYTYTTKYFPEKIAFMGAPKKDIVAIGTYGCIKYKEDKYHFEAGLYEMLQTLEPKVTLVYGRKPDKILAEYESCTKFIIYEDWMTQKHSEVKNYG